MSQAPTGGREAIDRLFRHPELTMERLPVLKDAMTNLASDCGEQFRALCPYPSTFAIEESKLCNASEVLENYQEGIAFIFWAAGWDTRFVIGLDRATVFQLVESVFGGDGSERPESIERPLSKLELRLAGKLAELAAQSLNRFLESIAEIDLSLERIEPAIAPGMFGSADPPVVGFRIGIQLIDQRGGMFVLIPQLGIYPLRSKLERRSGNPTAYIDEDWAGRLKSKIEGTSVSLRAVIPARRSTLREVAALKVGSIIELPMDAQNEIAATCNGSEVFTARLVQSKGYYALAVNSFAKSPQHE